MPDASIVPDVNDEFGDTNVILFCVYQQPLPGENQIREDRTYTFRELDVISEHIKDELRLLPGVAKSAEYGVRQEAIYVETDISTWSQLSLTTSELQQLVQSRNIVASGGTIDSDVGRLSIKPGGELDAVDELDSIVGGMAGGTDQDGEERPVYLQDLGLKIVRDYEDPPSLICRFTGPETSQPCVVVALTMKSGANIVTICEAAKERIRQMQTEQQSIPDDIAITAISDQSVNVNKKISDVVSNVVGAILIVIVVVYLIVGFRSAAVMASNIPVVVLGSLALITLFGVQLEQISLASIIIALGLLVDNAVQVCDSVAHQSDGGHGSESGERNRIRPGGQPDVDGHRHHRCRVCPDADRLERQHEGVRLQPSGDAFGYAGNQLGLGDDVLHAFWLRRLSVPPRIRINHLRRCLGCSRNCNRCCPSQKRRQPIRVSRTATSLIASSAPACELPSTSK